MTRKGKERVDADFVRAWEQLAMQREKNREKDQRRRERNQVEHGKAKKPRTEAGTPARVDGGRDRTRALADERPGRGRSARVDCARAGMRTHEAMHVASLASTGMWAHVERAPDPWHGRRTVQHAIWRADALGARLGSSHGRARRVRRKRTNVSPG